MDGVQVAEATKIILPFPDFGPSTRFISQGYGVPDDKRLHIDAVSLYVDLRDTHHAPPEKAIAFLLTGDLETEEGRMPVREPIGTLEWLDRSGPPWIGTTTGFLRSTLATFIDDGLRVVFVMKEHIELGSAAGGTPLSHAVVLGRLVERPHAARPEGAEALPQ